MYIGLLMQFAYREAMHKMSRPILPRTKPVEYLVEVRSDSDVIGLIYRQTWV